jgi:hypothetical protein
MESRFSDPVTLSPDSRDIILYSSETTSSGQFEGFRNFGFSKSADMASETTPDRLPWFPDFGNRSGITFTGP